MDDFMPVSLQVGTLFVRYALGSLIDLYMCRLRIKLYK